MGVTSQDPGCCCSTGPTCNTCTVNAGSLTVSWTSTPANSCSICNFAGSTVIPSGSVSLALNGTDGCNTTSHNGFATNATVGGCVTNPMIQSCPNARVTCASGNWNLTMQYCCGFSGVDLGVPISRSCNPLMIVYQPAPTNGGSCYYQSVTVSE